MLDAVAEVLRQSGGLAGPMVPIPYRERDASLEPLCSFASTVAGGGAGRRTEFEQRIDEDRGAVGAQGENL